MKNYYEILGVSPKAEQIVIRAAYRALAQRYHPDRVGLGADATSRMAEINEAYEVLSDPSKREHYDGLRDHHATSSQFDEREDDLRATFDEAASAMQSRWETAVEYYPDLVEVVERLRRISSRLAFAFQTTVLEKKAFDKRIELATELEGDFLATYFGDDRDIVRFALQLIQTGHRAAAKELNRAVAVLGSQADARRIIGRISQKYRLWQHDPEILHIAKIVLGSPYATGQALDLLERVGGTTEREIVEHGAFGRPKKWKISVAALGKRTECATLHDVAAWVRQVIAPEIIAAAKAAT